MHEERELTGSLDHSKTGPEEAAKQVGELLSSTELAEVLENDHFKQFLDNLPVAIVVAKITAQGERIVYANLAFESLSGQTAAAVIGEPWAALDAYRDDEKPDLHLGKAILEGEEFLGTFRRDVGDTKLTLVEGYGTVIEP